MIFSWCKFKKTKYHEQLHYKYKFNIQTSTTNFSQKNFKSQVHEHKIWELLIVENISKTSKLKIGHGTPSLFNHRRQGTPYPTQDITWDNQPIPCREINNRIGMNDGNFKSCFFMEIRHDHKNVDPKQRMIKILFKI